MHRLIVAVATLIAVLATARLGVWQLDRAAQKAALQAQLDERAALPPLPPAQLASTPAAAVAQHQRVLRVEGRWLPERTLFLDNRQMGDGRPGFFVVTPLQLSDGSALLVQRGWVPRDPSERTRLPAVPTPPGSVELTGRIAPPPARLFEFEAGGSGSIRQNLDLDAFGRETGLRFRPLSLLQTGAAPDGLRRDWPAPATGLDKHRGYAFQWFALSATIAGLYVWFQLVKPRLRRP